MVQVNDSLQPSQSDYQQPIQEDMDEGIHRMMDEGGGVVSQNYPEGHPILRNDLVIVDEDKN